MKNTVLILIILPAFFLIACGYEETMTIDTVPNAQIEEEFIEDDEVIYMTDQEMQDLFDNQISEKQVLILGRVVKNLADDNEGSRHQKFIVELESEQSILVSHNIDLAERIDDLQEGDQVIVYGQYEWNDRGGVIHWTHHDPDGQHVGGWVEHENDLYE